MCRESIVRATQSKPCSTGCCSTTSSGSSGDRINFHPHLYLLVAEGGVDRAGTFRRLPQLDDARLAETA